MLEGDSIDMAQVSGCPVTGRQRFTEELWPVAGEDPLWTTLAGVLPWSEPGGWISRGSGSWPRT